MKLGHTIEDSRKKYPELTEELLLKLEEWIRERNLSGIPIEQLAIFAHSCNFQTDATLRCMEAYYKIKKNCPQIFSNRDSKSESLEFTLNVIRFAALPVPDPNGYRIICHGLKDPDPNKHHFEDDAKLIMMTIDANLYTEGCEPGYLFILDMADVKLAHLAKLPIRSLQKFFEYIQEGMPIRLKGIHILNATWIFDKLLMIIKPFVRSEFLKLVKLTNKKALVLFLQILFQINSSLQIHTYTGQVSEIHKYIPPKYLPKDYGGELDSFEVFHEQNSLKLQQLKDYFLEEETIRQNYNASLKKKT
ncbi:hypothetical protein M0802_011424 [Mischocyttarus mexicanus]|nr:hypothetical protein M0802_011424 [Mischocyttarus mexicanus]